MPQSSKIVEWRQRVIGGETLLSIFKAEWTTINNPTPDTVNVIIQESPDWNNRVILVSDGKATICIPTNKGWLVLDQADGQEKFTPRILGALAAEENTYLRERYFLSGMCDHDVLNYIEE